MSYYVIAPDGTRYGPADIPTLNSWIAQGRLTPHTLLEDASGIRMSASAVAGLVFSASAREQRGYHHTYYVPRPDDGQGDLVASWVLGALSLAACPIIPSIFGLHFAGKAKEKGHPGANAARIFNIVTLTVPIALFCLWLVLISAVMSAAPPRSQPRVREVGPHFPEFPERPPTSSQQW